MLSTKNPSVCEWEGGNAIKKFNGWNKLQLVQLVQKWYLENKIKE